MGDRDEQAFGFVIIVAIIISVIVQCSSSDKDYNKAINEAEYVYDRN